MARKRRGRGKGGGVQVPALPLAPSAPHPGGRPSKLTAEATRLVCDAILKGAGREDAAGAAGIAPSTLYLWLSEGAKREPGEFLEFLEAVEGAERQLVADCSAGMVELTGKNTPPAVRFAALKLILQSRRPALWRPAKEVAISAPGGGPVQVEVSGAVEATLRPLVTLEDLRKMTREETEATLLAEAERQDQANREEPA